MKVTVSKIPGKNRDQTLLRTLVLGVAGMAAAVSAAAMSGAA